MLLVVASSDMRKRAATEDFDLDLEMGAGTDNDFDLVLADRVRGLDVVYIPGTPFGGVIDSDKPVMDADGERISYHGSTWTGVLDQNITRPPSGQSHLTVSGNATECMSRLLEACGVGEPFAVVDGAPGEINYRVPRFATLYEAIVGALASAGLALGIESGDGHVRLFAREPATVDQSRGTGYEAERGYRPVNHLVALGKGEMVEREVIDLYADEHGAISKSQSIFGIAHRAIVYELSAKSGAELELDARKKLASLQANRDSAKVTVGDGLRVSIGDSLSVISPTYGVKASATVTGIVLEVSEGAVSITPRTNGVLGEDMD